MALSGGLSNNSIQSLLQCLTEDRSDQEQQHDADPRLGWPDGRRRSGEVGEAIVSVLTAAGSEMRVKAIHAEVERLLGEPVSRYSVSDYLRRRAKRPSQLFLRTRTGHYRLLSAGE